MTHLKPSGGGEKDTLLSHTSAKWRWEERHSDGTHQCQVEVGRKTLCWHTPVPSGGGEKDRHSAGTHQCQVEVGRKTDTLLAHTIAKWRWGERQTLCWHTPVPSGDGERERHVSLSTFRSLYVRMAELQLSGTPARVLHNVTSETCARTCVEEVTFECKSFDLDQRQGSCSLFNTSYEDGVMFLQEATFVDHYRIFRLDDCRHEVTTSVKSPMFSTWIED
ncbi:hypothetical protein ACOMHN_007392 [Nucella lapillus]